jgi:predicted MFS family arabinose efflux permease
VAALPEPARDRPPFTPAALRPRLALAAPLRRPFLALLPCLVATWALGGLYLSLGPSVVLSLEHSTNRLWGGIAVFLLCGAGAVASVALRGWPPRRGVVVGCALLAVGVVVSLVAVAASATVPYLVGSTIAGAGFGCAFLSAFRSLAGRAAPADRGGLIAAIYVASYLAFSVPALVAGVATVRFGLRPTALGYGALVAASALLAVVLTARRPVPAAGP